MWSCVNSVIGRFHAHKLISEAISLDSVNCYFNSAALTPYHQSAESFVLPPSEQFDDDDVFLFSDVTTSTVLSHLESLDTRKSAGPDGLSARFLKEIAYEIAAPLTSLFNFSLRHGTFPAAWKQSNITPIHKGGPVDDPSNYRPISVIPVIVEKIVSVQLSSYLETNHLFHPHQGAYRSGKSTEDILQLAVDHIVNCLDNKQTVCAAFLDLRKAFDSLDHCLLLHRLQDLGVGTVVLQWFQNYLSDRRHRIKRSNTFSDWLEMQGGIPQGSTLGPLLFLVYMNSLPSQVTQGLLLQYADDTTLICSGFTPDIVATTVSIQLSHIQSWIDRSRMKLNFTKSCVMWFSVKASRQPTYPPITVDNSILRVVTEQRYLGLVFDSQLSWSSHVSGVCKKMSYYLYLLNSHRHVLNNTMMKLLLDSLVLSHIYYALSVWGPSLNVQLSSRLKRMQNMAVRLVFSLKKYDHVSDHYKRLHWLPLDQFIKFRFVCSMYKQFHQGHSIPLEPPIQFGQSHSHHTRTSSSFAGIVRFNLKFSQRFFRYRVTQWWNSLPSQFAYLPFNTFIDAVRSHLERCDTLGT